MIVLDTHALVWWLAGSSALSAGAKRAIKRAASASQVVASTISLLEITTAVRRGRMEFAQSLDRWLEDVRLLPELRFEPVSFEIAHRAGSFGDEMHGDPADRIIAATAMVLKVSLVTTDEKLRKIPALSTVW